MAACRAAACLQRAPPEGLRCGTLLRVFSPGTTCTVSFGAGNACAGDGSDYSYQHPPLPCETVDAAAQTRTVTTNHCPNHPQQSYNPNYAVSEVVTYVLPLEPVLVTSDAYSRGLGNVGGA
eukprot:gene51476-29110_t